MQGFPESIKKDINAIVQVAVDLKMKAYVVGGFPRDLVSGKGVTTKTDLDITEENGNAFDLAFFVAARYKLQLPIVYESSGTAMLTMPSGRIIEFHNAYYNVPHILDQLYKIRIEPTSLNKDVYSRDFTINTLLYDPLVNKILDLTKMGVRDIKNKILRTPINPFKTLGLDPKRVLRGIRFKIEMGLKPTPEYEKAEKHFAPTLANLLIQKPNSKMVQETIKKIFNVNSQRGYEEFKKLGLLPYIPRVEGMDQMALSNIFGNKKNWYKKSQLMELEDNEIETNIESPEDISLQEKTEDPIKIEEIEPVIIEENKSEEIKEDFSNSIKEQNPKLTRDENFKKWFKNSEIVNEDGNPLVVYHGTTHAFESFNLERAGMESFFGKSLYFTDSPEDASQNYAGIGVDLTTRIEDLADRLSSDIDYNDEAKLNELGFHRDVDGNLLKSDGMLVQHEDVTKALAIKELVGPHEGAVMPVYLSVQNPFVLDEHGPNETINFDYTHDREGEITGVKGNGWKILENTKKEIYKYESKFFKKDKIEKIIGDISVNLIDNSPLSSLKLFNVFNDNEAINYIEDPSTGELIGSGQIVANIIFASGYDGIVMDVHDYFGGRKFMENIPEGTKHYIIRNPRKVKSAIGNVEFNPRKKSILKKDLSEIKVVEKSLLSRGKFFSWYKISQKFLEERKPEETDFYYNPRYEIDIQNDAFIHFTTKENAENIIRTGMFNPSKSEHVFAVSAIYGTWFPEVQYAPQAMTSKRWKDEDMVAIYFITDKKPIQGHFDEVFWKGPVPIIDAEIISVEEAKKILSSTPEKLQHKEKMVPFGLGWKKPENIDPTDLIDMGGPGYVEYAKSNSKSKWYKTHGNNSMIKESKIKKLPNGKYRVVKKDGTGNLGTCNSLEEAKNRLKEVEYFKHKKAQKTPIPQPKSNNTMPEKMINRILDEREKHRAYMRRKRMENRKKNIKVKELFDNIEEWGVGDSNLNKFVDDKKIEKTNRINRIVDKDYAR